MDTLNALKLEHNNVDRIAILIYIEAVATWLHMPIKDAKKKGIIICTYSSDINNYIVETYSVLSAQGR